MAIVVKICGVTNAEDAVAAVECGADLVGLNFVRGSKREIDTNVATKIVGAVGARATLVAVVANLDVDASLALRSETGIEWLQLHGSEPPSRLEALLPCAYKAIRVAGAADLEAVSRYAGDRVLLDTKVGGALGGTGEAFDWDLAVGLGRRFMLAGGLNENNVARAVGRVAPWGVDVASGVERADDPRRKDPEKMRRFVESARGGSAG